MQKIYSIDSTSGVVVCDAGVILSQLNDYVSPYNYIVPLDLGTIYEDI